MILGYSLIIAAAIFWGLSATWARSLISDGVATPLLISQTRVMFSWAILAIIIAIRNRKAFVVAPKDLAVFAVLGIFGIAGANYFLYRAIGQMNAALADLLQFLAPLFVVVWLWLRKIEPLDPAKAWALGLSLVGCTLALGVSSDIALPPVSGIVSGVLSAICFATTLVLGKSVSSRYGLMTYLHYALLAATIFWLIVISPMKTIEQIQTGTRLAKLMTFAITSILVPYLLFFAGLKYVPASRASIVSTFEPVVVALASFLFLSESLSAGQVIGILLVCGAIALVEITSDKAKATAPLRD